MYFYRENILILFRLFAVVVVIVLSLIFCCWIDFCRVWLRLIFSSLNMVEILRWINDLAIWIAHVSQILLFPFCFFFSNWWMRASSILFATVTVNFPFIYYTYYMNEWMHNICIHRIKPKSKCTSQSLSIPLYFHCHILSDLFLIFFSFFLFFFIILSDCFNQFP